ncbi:MAG: aldo/keto reductase, partial [Clostridia bacterium]
YIGQSLMQIRKNIILATKSPALSFDAMTADIDKSLHDLKTDYIDIYQIHNIKDEKAVDVAFGENGAMEALYKAQKAGKIRFIGLTSHIKDTLFYAIKRFEKDICTIMYPFNIVETEGSELMKTATNANIGTLAMKPLGGGNLDDVQLSIRFILQNPNINIALMGIGDSVEAEFDAKINCSPLTENELLQCQQIRAKLGSTFCRRCNYCAPCAVGIDIPTMFTFQNYLNNYALANWAINRYQSMKVDANACIKCGVCETRCPYNINIRERIAKVAIDFNKAINNK